MRLQAALARTISGFRIEVKSVILDGTANRVVLTGTALSQDDLHEGDPIAAQFAGGEDNVANVITVVGSQQVMLQVTVAEVNREAVKQLGINLERHSHHRQRTTLGFQNNPALGGASNVITTNGFGVSGGIPGLAINATLRALERNAALRTLAEPNLTAMSGQEAEFLAGGEFPVPTDVDNGKITYTFKEFGVRS